jgi:SAM-dependent methyltransferase
MARRTPRFEVEGGPQLAEGSVPVVIASRFWRVYGLIAGVHPRLRPWHAQWLSGSIIYRDLRRVLPELHGRVLDVGCGDKPYASWLSSADEHVGIDVTAGPQVDVVIDPHEPWPLADGSFDAALCLQVIEHASDVDNLLSQTERVLRPGGRLVVTVPFAYSEHDDPHDYRRLSRHGVQRLLGERFDVIEVRPQGGIGSTAGVLLLNWVELMAFRSRPALGLFMLALPVWLVFSLMVNLLGALADRLDRTSACYGNVLGVAAKRA